MYESLITRIVGDIAADIVKREEDYLMESVYKVGFGIDKEELAKALQYDRDQYEKGFKDGRSSAEPKWIPVTERLPEDGTEVWVTTEMLSDVTRACWHKDSNLWCHPYNSDCLLALRPIAWMEMSVPEPYKGGADTRQDDPSHPFADSVMMGEEE